MVSGCQFARVVLGPLDALEQAVLPKEPATSLGWPHFRLRGELIVGEGCWREAHPARQMFMKN
jgi:hypothetical protein